MWTSAYAYTEYGTMKKKADARGVESHYAYDPLHNVTQIWFTGVGGDDSGSVRPSLPSGVAATEDRNFGYTGWGALSSVTVSNKYTETFAFDDFLQVSSVTRWILGQTSDTRKTYTTSYEYNMGGQLSKMIYPSGQQVAVNHDDKGRMQSLTYEPGDTSGYLTAMGYNIAGQVTGLTLGNGVVESYGYDANRLQMTSQTATKGANSLMNLTYNYQATAGQMGTGSTAGNAGQLMGISGTINSTTESAAYTYDLLGRLATSDQTSNGSTAKRRFDYDRWGNRTGVWDAVSGGNQIQNVTLQQSGGAPTNRIQTVYPPRINFAASSNGSTATASSTESAAYAASAAINGDRKGQSWGEAGGGWMDKTANTYPDWLQVDLNGSKTIDEIDVFTLQDNYTNPSEPTESMTFSQYGIVDFQIQYWTGLAWQTVSGGSVTSNNKVWKKVSFSQITTSKIRVNVTSALASKSRITELEAWGPGIGINYTYDSAGNVTNDGLHTYSYDAENRLVSVDSGTTAQYRYDQQNRRVSKIVGSSWTHYVWQGSQVIGEHDATTAYSTSPPYQVKSARLDYVYSGARMIQSRQRTSSTGSWTSRYFLNDRLSVRMTLDGSGNVVGRQAHLPFGDDFGETGTQEKHHFTSYERDSEAASDYAVNRPYSQGVGRFASADPYSPSGGLTNPQSLNRYVYVLNKAVDFVDPSGLNLANPGGDWPLSCSLSYGSGEYEGHAVVFFTGFSCPASSGPAPGGGDSTPRCTMHVETKKGDRIDELTPAVGLQFPGGKNIIGPAAFGISEVGPGPPHPINNGYYYNVYIYANLWGRTGVWFARQEAWISQKGTFWNGTDPGSETDPGPLQDHRGPDEGESPRIKNQWQSNDLLAWVDSPGYDPNFVLNQGYRPYNLTIRYTFTSWVELDGKKICSKNWSYTLQWKNGENKKWDAH